LFLLVLVCVTLVVAAGLFVLRDGEADPAADDRDCDGTRVALSVDPRIASVVQEATADLSPWLAPEDCFALDVVSQTSATTAAEIARPEGVGLSAPLPDLWLPDSSVWLQQAGAGKVGARRLGAESVSVATSPIVLAVSRAQASGWPASSSGVATFSCAVIVGSRWNACSTMPMRPRRARASAASGRPRARSSGA
jgi:hypothetical protein